MHEGKSCNNGALFWNKAAQRSTRQRVTMAKRRRSAGIRTMLKKRGRSFWLFGARTPGSEMNAIQRRVKTLKKLIPSSKKFSADSREGLDGLFKETADYILCMESRVKLMQIMVEALAGSDE